MRADIHGLTSMKTLYALLVSLLFISTCRATTFYMSPTGRDSQAGTSAAAPWATPNHALNCGDVILASPGNYPNLSAWGTVSCPTENNVAWLKCATFDACKISITSGNQYYAGMQVGQSYWGVQGWEVTTSASTGACFFAYPATPSANIHHIIFANDIANGCGQSGFEMSPNGSAGVDYFVVIGNIAYNAVQGSYNCTSGVNTFKPVASDSLPGTHIYFAGNFAYENVEPSTCAGGKATDGQGFFFDTTAPYSQQMVMDNNIAIFNGGSGIKSYLNASDNAVAKMYFRHNTVGGNETGGVNGAVCAEIGLQSSVSAELIDNLIVSGVQNACSGSSSLYLLGIMSGDSSVQVYSNYAYNAWGNYVSTYGSNVTFGRNASGTNPNFPIITKPAAPDCGQFSSVPNCMASLVADLTPQTAAAKSYGYQVPQLIPVYDPFFPQWLCNARLPAGLVTLGCADAPEMSSNNTN